MSEPAVPPPPAVSQSIRDGGSRMSSRSARLVRGAILFAILLAATLLRFHDITRHALWGDELLTLEASAGHAMEHESLGRAGFVEAPDLMTLKHAGPWWRVATSLARNDKHPPLYFLIERAWWELAGDSPLALRSLSLAFSVAAVALLYFAAEPLVGAASALWAAALMAFAIPQIHYGQEGRMYALLLALLLASCAVLVRLEKRGPSWGRAALLGACLLAMMLTHYFAVAPCAALAVYAAARIRGRALRQAAVAAVVAGVIYLIVWGPFFWLGRANLNSFNWWLIDDAPGHVGRTWWKLALVPARMLAEPRPSAETAAAIGCVLFVVPALLLRRQPELLLWWLLLVLSPLPSLVTDLWPPGRKQLEWVRYALPAAPAVYVLLAALVPRGWRGWRAVLRHALPAGALLLCVLNLGAGYAETENPKPEWRPLAALIDAHAQPGDVMVFYGTHPGEAGYAGFYYVALSYYCHRMPRQLLFPTGPETAPTAEEVARLRQAPGIWVVVPWGLHYPPEALAGFAPGPRTGAFLLPSVQRWTPLPATTQSR